MSKEAWKPIPGYEGLYEVSDLRENPGKNLDLQTLADQYCRRDF